jgi:hypothetical protein
VAPDALTVGGRVITSDKAFDILVEACPSYWAAADLDHMLGLRGGRGRTCSCASRRSHHLVQLVAERRTDECALCSAVEQLLVDGDEDVSSPSWG